MAARWVRAGGRERAQPGAGARLLQAEDVRVVLHELPDEVLPAEAPREGPGGAVAVQLSLREGERGAVRGSGGAWDRGGAEALPAARREGRARLPGLQ